MLTMQRAQRSREVTLLLLLLLLDVRELRERAAYLRSCEHAAAWRSVRQNCCEWLIAVASITQQQQ